MADQDPYAATAVKPAVTASTGDPYAATAVQPTTPPTWIPGSGGTIRKPTERERFLEPGFYPVGMPGEGVGENLHNLAQRAGVGIFQLADSVLNPGRTARSLAGSLLPDEVINWLNKSPDAKGREIPTGVPNPVAQAYQAVAPGGWEAFGNMAPMVGQAIAGEAFSVAAPEIRAGTRSAAESFARTATGTGETPVVKLVEKRTAENEKINAVNQDRLVRQQRDQTAADDKYRSDLLKLRQGYEQEVRDAQEKARTGTAQDRAQYQSKQLAVKQKYDQSVRDATEKHTAAKAKAEQANVETQREYNRKIGRVAQQNRQVSAAERAKSDQAARAQVSGSQLIYGLRQLDQALRERANQMYGAVRERMSSVSLPSDTLADAVRAAQEKWIRGSPEKVREFNAMLSTGAPSPELMLADQTAQNMGYKNFREAITNPQMRDTLSRALPPDVWQAAIGQGTKPVSWNDLQGFYEETGAKIADGPQPGKGDIYKALQEVHNYVGDQMQQLADAQGVGKEFLNARIFYRDYMQTFHTPAGPSGSGSAVAQALLSKDPERAVAYFAGKSGNRGIADLRQYSDGLANLAQNARQTAQTKIAVPPGGRKSVADIPQPKTTPVPAGANLPLPPVMEAAPSPRAANLPLPPTLPEPKTIPVELKPGRTISAADIQRAREAAAASRRQWVNRRGAWVATWPVFEAMRALWGGHIPSIPAMALESAGTYAMVRATTALMEHPPMIRFLTQARPEDVALIPPELRGDLPGLVSIAQKQGIKVAPALIAAVTGTTGQQREGQGQTAPPISPAQAIQAIQAVQPPAAGGAQ